MEHLQEKKVNLSIDKKNGNLPVEIKTVCRQCGKVHFTEPNESGKPDTVITFIENYKTLCGWLVQQKCTQCYSPQTMECFANNKTLVEFWDWINKEVIIEVPVIEMAPPATKSEAIKYFINECKNCLAYRRAYLENATIKNRFDLVKPISPVACGVTENSITVFGANNNNGHEITGYEYDKLKKAFLKGV